MPLASTTAAYTLIGLASKFQEFFYHDAGDVTFEYMNEDGEKLTTSVPNVAKVTADLQANAVTDAELEDALKAYYVKTDVDGIADAIVAKFGDYYKKNEIDGKINTLNNTISSNKTTAHTELVEVQEVLHGEVVDADMTNVMSKAQFEANAAARREQYAGNGFIDLTKKYGRLSYINKGGLAVWKKNDSYFGDSKLQGSKLYIGDESNPNYEKPSFNINGELVVLKSGRYFGEISLPETQVAPVISDSTQAPDMKQGDMAVLTDLNRDILENINISNPSSWGCGRCSATTDDDGGIKISVVDTNYAYVNITFRAKTKLNGTINGVKYKIRVKIDFGTADSIIFDYWNTINNDHFITPSDVDENGWHEFTLTASHLGTTDVLFGFHPIFGSDINTDDYCFIRDLEVIQVSETPIVALQDVPAGDIYDHADKFETRSSISKQDLVFLELTMQHAA
jgi:hypothetical protein